jgi:hypothetical protein
MAGDTDPASRELAVEIGRIPLRLQFADERQLQKAAARYRVFRGNRYEGLPVSVGTVRQRGDLNQPHFEYTLDSATVRLGRDRAEFTGVPHEYSLDSLIRILLSKILLSRRGFLLHAASVMRNGQAHIFTGHSGAGKSTVASLSPTGSVLTDEISLIRGDEDTWRAFGTPFWGEFHAGDLNQEAPVRGIYSLVQAAEDRVERLSTRDALRALLPNILFFSAEPADHRQLLRILTEALAEVPVYRLYFRKHSGFWEVLR